MLSELTAFLVALLTLFIGGVFGYLAHTVSFSLRKNGEWESVPDWKKRNLGLAGWFAAFLAGSIVLAQAESFQPQEVMARMWAAQVLAGWLGPMFLDFVWERWTGGSGDD